MATEIVVPRLGWSMDEGVFVAWLKKDGDRVSPGDILFQIEGDKATEDVETLDRGILRIPEGAPVAGDPVRVGQVVAFLVAADGEELPLLAAAPPAAVSDTTPAIPSHSSATPPPAPARSEGRTITPRAARLAAALGVDWRTVEGTGRGGRVRERDIRSVSGRPKDRRHAIAERMSRGAHEAAPVTLTRQIDATLLETIRERGLAFSAIWAKLCANALKEHPLLRSAWIDGRIETRDAFDIAVAVDTDRGLLAPVLQGAHEKPLRQLDGELRELAQAAREGRLGAQPVSAFTITNLGGHGIDAFTPILHLPQSAILGLGRICRTPVVIGDEVVVRTTMWLSLTFDHRVLDGAPAARFLVDLARAVEDTDRMEALERS